jgi:hypothetical protein
MAGQMGESDRFIASLQKLLSIPYATALAVKRATHSLATSARSDVRSAPEGCAVMAKFVSPRKLRSRQIGILGHI